MGFGVSFRVFNQDFRLFNWIIIIEILFPFLSEQLILIIILF